MFRAFLCFKRLEERFMKPKEVLGLLKDSEAKFVDFRFTDTKGKEQHVTVPAHTRSHTAWCWLLAGAAR